MSIEAMTCSYCGSDRLRLDIPVSKLGISYLSGIVVKTKPIKANLCEQCGNVNLYLEDPQALSDKEVVPRATTNFLPFVIFALFILSLQLDS